MAKRITTAEFETEVLENLLLTIVDFYMDTCIPCKQLAPLLSELEERYESKVSIVKVNANYEPDLVEKYGIVAAPTLLFFKGGEVITKTHGLQPEEKLVELIEANL